MKNFTARTAVRLSAEELAAFKANCDSMRKSPSYVIREFIVAFNNNRLRITPDVNDAQIAMELYDDN